MPELKHVSRTGNPQGKPRVFFSCHPHDFGASFEQLSRDILRISNCAIFYFDPNSDGELESDDLFNLSQMQLFVMPVTRRLLQEPSRAMDVEFQFAREHHIPVLPIMLENQLEHLFSQKFGNMQFLSAAAQDDTAIPFAQKLEKHLTGVLVGDELAAKVRSAFDATVFLSYRKKDRKHAQELMRLIHNDALCRDVAIWYDEFLTPGEDFNDTIADALQKSQLFVLAVTPNVVNEINYIMTTEYSMARGANKPILPVELVPTDGGMLRAAYEGIPACTDAYDAQALADALAAKLGHVLPRESRRDPQHDFYIGLAYLNGIDVEVNRERALALITGAANTGLIEAMQKVRDMYMQGDGVRADVKTAGTWTGKLTIRLYDQFDDDPTQAHGMALAKELWNLGDHMREAGDMHRAQLAYEEMKKVLLSFEPQWVDDEARRMLGMCCKKLGDAARDAGDPKEAEAHYRDALQVFLPLHDKLKTARAAWDAALVIMNLGDLVITQDPKDALNHYMLGMKFLAEAESIAESDEYKARIARNMAVCQNDASRAYYAMAQQSANAGTAEYPQKAGASQKEEYLSLAELYALRSFEINERLYKESQGNPTVNVISDRAMSCILLGDICLARGQQSQAVQHYLDSLKLLWPLYERYRIPRYANSLYDLYNCLEQLYMKRNDWKNTEICCENRLELLPALTSLQAPQKQEALVNTYHLLATIRAQDKRFDEALRYLDAALEHSEQLYQMTATEPVASAMTAMHNEKGNIHAHLQQPDKAELCYQAGWNQAKRAYETFRTLSAGLEVVNCCYTLGKLYRRNNLPEVAIEHYALGIKQCCQLPGGREHPSVVPYTAKGYKTMGDICLEFGWIDDARMYYGYNVSFFESICAKCPTPEYTAALQDAYDDLASVSAG